jgi:hypothetical protein
MGVLNAVTNFVGALPVWIHALTGMVAAASAFTALTPSPKDDSFLAKVYAVLNVLALNVGNAQNK